MIVPKVDKITADTILEKAEQLFYGKNNYTAFEMAAIEEEFENFINSLVSEDELLPYEMVRKLRELGWTVSLKTKEDISLRMWSKYGEYCNELLNQKIPPSEHPLFPDWLKERK